MKGPERVDRPKAFRIKKNDDDDDDHFSFPEDMLL